MDTDELMALALEMVGFTEVPADSQILVPGTNLRRLLVGIDIGVGELLLAREQGFDGVIAHHPAGGHASVRFHHVLRRHAELMEEAGVPHGEALRAVEELSAPRETAGHAANYDRVPAFARFLRLPFLNIHQPWDEMGRQRMVGALEACDEDATVEDGVAALHALPEFGVAETDIVLRLGEPAHPSAVGRSPTGPERTAATPWRKLTSPTAWTPWCTSTSCRRTFNACERTPPWRGRPSSSRATSRATPWESPPTSSGSERRVSRWSPSAAFSNPDYPSGVAVRRARMDPRFRR